MTTTEGQDPGLVLWVQQMAANGMAPELIADQLAGYGVQDGAGQVRAILGLNGSQPAAPDDLREAGRMYYRPGLPLPDGAEELRGQLDDDYAAELARITRQRRLARDADRDLDAAEEAMARGGRRVMTWAELTELPEPVWVLDPMLTTGFHGLAGPPEAGKSLLVRDWCCDVAASGRTAVYAYSEGEFDLEDRFGAHPRIAAASDWLVFHSGGLNLASRSDVAWFCQEYRERSPALIVFDMIYGFGLTDDNTVKGVAPVVNGAKDIARELSAAVVAVGHPGLQGERRFRGSSMWRGLFETEWHAAGGSLTCEKHKYADKRRMGGAYRVDFPHLAWMDPLEDVARQSQRAAVIAQDFTDRPRDSDASRARRLAGSLGVSEQHVRRLVREYRKQNEADSGAE